MKGTVKWFNEKKGFGFIVSEEGNEDVFVHYKEIVGDGFKSLKENDKVEYETEETGKGLKAVQVKRI